MSRIPIPLFLSVILITITTVSCSSISTTNSNLPTTFQRPSYQSKALSHIEHVEWYHLDHEDRHLYNTESVSTGTGLSSHISYPFSSRRTRLYNGLTLHFPEHVHLSVRALGTTYYLSLHLVAELKAPNSTIITNDGTYAASLTTYRSYRREPRDTWAIVTFRPDGTFQGLLIVDGEVIGIDHVEQHQQEMEESHYHSMTTTSPHGMIAYKYSSFKSTHVHECGVKHQETNEVRTEPMTPSQMGRHLLATVINDPGNGICDGEPCRWLDDGAGQPCWPGITATNVKSMTFIPMADFGYYKIYNSIPAAQSAIDQTIAIINGIYVPQIGIFNKVVETIIMTQAGGAGMTNGFNYDWNKAPLTKGAKCDSDTDQGYIIDTMLNDLTTYNKQDLVNGVVKASERHIFTNCYPPSGTVGLAWVGTINGRGGQATGVSSYTSSHWLTIAHEVGHNLGAPHTFGPDGTSSSGSYGNVGGIMDYTDTGEFPRRLTATSPARGIPQFHPVLTRPKICPQLKAAMTNDRSYVAAYVQPWKPICGNSILEAGEDCDDTSGCCDLSTCSLVSGAQCTPGKGNSNPCCDANTCLYKSTQYGCPGGNSYCLMGTCTKDGCTTYSNTAQCPNREVTSPDYPGLATADGCTFGCSLTGKTSSTSVACTYPPTFPGSDTSYGTVPDGAVCNDGSGKFTFLTLKQYGICKSQKCEPTTAPKPPVKYGDPGFVTPPPTNPPPTGVVTAKPTTPSSTTTVPPTSTPGEVYKWAINSGFSSCMDSSGAKPAGCNLAGTQTRSVVCRNSKQVDVDMSNCNNIAQTKPVTSQACTGNCTYSWYADPKGWSSCSYDCTSPSTSPTQFRSIFCYEAGDTTRSNPLSTNTVSSPCLQTGSPPTSSQPCNTQLCPVTIKVPDFDAVCSRDCGVGVQTRTVSCFYTQNTKQFSIDQTNTDSRWGPFITACKTALQNANPQPVTSQTCNTQPCAQFNWKASNFGTCSATCKPSTGTTPTRTRIVTCVQTINNVDTNVGDDKCIASLKPVTTENCNTQQCAVYSWVLTDWSTCNAKCGGGLQTRSVLCKDGSGLAASDNTCTDSPKPISQQTCNTQLCDLFAWRTTEYGVCTATCGGGTQTRTVSCYNTIVASPQPTVDDSKCATAGAKPVSQQACSQQACPRYAWLAGDYSNCNTICGGGERTRSVKCIQIGPNDIVSDSLCTGTKPDTSEKCNTNPCQQANWRTGAWGACSQTCGTGGIRTRVVDCVDQASNPAQGCDAAIKPVSQESCNTQTCPTQWLAGTFGQCSKPCGVGTYTRSVTCVYRDTQKPTGDDSLCSSTQPTSSSVCNTFACPTYRAGVWGPCRSPLGCGDGLQTRPLTCFDSSGTQVDIQLCASATAPFTQQTCSLDPCPHWHRDPWNDCSQPCGGGTQTRSLTCRMPHDAIWQGQKAGNDSLCPDINISGADGDAADSKSGLATIQACNTDPCASYYWNTTYGSCNKECGGGTQLATSICFSNTGSIAPNQALCTGPKPDPQRVCNTYLCPNYIWKAREWSQCSVYCGTGTQTRLVYCANISPNAAVLQETVDDSFCNKLGLPKLASQQTCINPTDTCSGSRSGKVDGYCVTSTNDPLYGTCKCKYGFAGPGCKEVPSIYDVTTDAGRVGTGIGVPVGDSLSISWKTTGRIDSVSIVLGQRGVRNPICRYVIVNKPLRNTASWVVGIGPDGNPMKNLLPGSGYYITVFALDSIQGSSAEFSIGDVCSVKACGFGTCQGGTCICQDAYTGEKCDIPRCTTSNCNVNGGKCSLVKQASGSFCECAAGWQGINCGTPKTCTATCGSGGDLAPFAVNDITNPSCPTGTSAQCICLPNYVFTGGMCRCDPGCSPYGGSAAPDCSGCKCSSGWFGRICERVYWTIRTQFIISGGTSWLQDEIAREDFGRTTSIDLAIAAGFPIERIIIDQVTIPGPTTAIVTFRLLSVASTGAAQEFLITRAGQRAGLFNPAVPTAEHHALAARRAAIALQADGLTPNQVTQIAELKQAYAILAAVLADSASYAWNGVGTIYMDRGYPITLADPSGKSGPLPPNPSKPDSPYTPDTPPSGGDGGSSSSSSNLIIIIAAAVAGGIVLLIVLAIVIYFCKRTSQKTTWTKDSAKMELRTFDSFNANANANDGGNNYNQNAAWAAPTAAPASSGVASWAKGMSSPSTPAVVPTSYAASNHVSPAAAASASPTSYAASNVGYNAYTSPANTTGYSSQEGYTANTTDVEANPLTLPAGWTQQFTNDGTPYYFNSVTSQTQWERPGTY